MRKVRTSARRVSVALIGAVLLAVAGPVLAQVADSSRSIFPPWQHGDNSDVPDRGVGFTVPQIDDLADFHGDLSDPKLVLYVGGNYFFAMAPLVQAFEARHPEYKGRIFWETIPPGVLVEQIKAGGRITCVNMTWTAKADVYLAGLQAVKRLISQGLLTGSPVPYATNALTIMVRKGNPERVASLADLARPGLRLALPNPQFEGVARQVKAALGKAGGEALVREVYTTKVAGGTAVLTRIHHRQTPLFLMQGVVDAGVTWQSEAMFQEQIGNPISHVDIPDAQNSRAIYAGAGVAGAQHPQAAAAWLGFIRSAQALSIFERYGFKPYDPSTPAAE